MASVRTILGRLAALIAPLLAISSSPAQAATAHTLGRHSLDDSVRQNAEFRRALSDTPTVLTGDAILQSAGLAAGIEPIPGLAAQKKPRGRSADARKHTRHRQQRHGQQRHRRRKHTH